MLYDDDVYQLYAAYLLDDKLDADNYFVRHQPADRLKPAAHFRSERLKQAAAKRFQQSLSASKQFSKKLLLLLLLNVFSMLLLWYYVISYKKKLLSP